MSDQFELTCRLPLLDEQGLLTRPGYARAPFWDYRREAVKASSLRRKEWDYYLISNGRFALALTISDLGYAGMHTVSLIDLEARRETTCSSLGSPPGKKDKLPEQSEYGNCHASGRGFGMHFLNDGKNRTLIVQMRRFAKEGPLSARIELTEEPQDSMCIATPFEEPGCFYYNRKIPCLRASGTVSCGGRDYVFDPADSFAVLDWGRGVWPGHVTWYWSAASGMTPDGTRTFGFNLGYGFGDTSAATENMLFCDGRAHKLGEVHFEIPMTDKGKYDYMKAPWHISSEDGRLDLAFKPVLDRKSHTNLLAVKSDQHQVFGHFSGRAVLDDGEEIRLQDFPGFAERVENKW